jgi:hypothetical protein
MAAALFNSIFPSLSPPTKLAPTARGCARGQATAERWRGSGAEWPERAAAACVVVCGAERRAAERKRAARLAGPCGAALRELAQPCGARVSGPTRAHAARGRAGARGAAAGVGAAAAWRRGWSTRPRCARAGAGARRQVGAGARRSTGVGLGWRLAQVATAQRQVGR